MEAIRRDGRCHCGRAVYFVRAVKIEDEPYFECRACGRSYGR